MHKAVIAPILAVVFLLIQVITGVEIGAETKAQVVEAVSVLVAFIVMVWGIFKNFRKDKVEEK